jgi:hypothetical protein
VYGLLQLLKEQMGVLLGSVWRFLLNGGCLAFIRVFSFCGGNACITHTTPPMHQVARRTSAACPTRRAVSSRSGRPTAWRAMGSRLGRSVWCWSA